MNIQRAPIRFKPHLKRVIWGGDRICKFKGIPSEVFDIGESWEISPMEGRESVVEEGPYAGKTIRWLVQEFGMQLLGSASVEKYGMRFPLLLKLIDARDDLSVQVHPDDELAEKRHGSLGKTELWYVISAEKGSLIYSGLTEEMTPEEYARRVADGTFAGTLARHEALPGDVFFLPAGRVHSIGAGVFLAEVQEASDITYRIYDYDRRDADGNPRELHTELAKDAIDYGVKGNYKEPKPSDTDKRATLLACNHFKVERLKVEGPTPLSAESSSFKAVMCVEGSGEVTCEDGSLKIRQGDTVLVPAASKNPTINGHATVLLVTVE